MAPEDAANLVEGYVKQSGFEGDSAVKTITGEQVYYGLALDGNNEQELVKVMNTDDCLRHFLVNATHQADLKWFLSQTADHILQPFPVGLSTPVGLVVANPAYGGEKV